MKKSLFFILILLLFVSGCVISPECGNGILDEGESSLTCCFDAGCEGTASCQNNVCLPTECGECQDLIGNECVDLECCDDNDCSDSESCENNVCEELNCGYCEYANGHECEELFCCNDADCYDNDDTTIDSCEQTEDGDAYCLNKERESDDECVSDSDCDEGYECVSNFCEEVELECGNCEVLVGGRCADLECAEGYECADNACILEEESGCSVDSNCAQGYEWINEECVEQEQIDCGEDFDCFVTQSETCSIASVDRSIFTNLFGVDQTTNSYYELRGWDDGKCVFYLKYGDLLVEYSDDLVQSLIDNGETLEEVQQREDDLNVLYDGLEGREGSCRFESSDLNAMLERWNNGQYSGGASCSLNGNEWECTYTGDFEAAESCEGEYFNPNL
jgi:hypothetical protein